MYMDIKICSANLLCDSDQKQLINQKCLFKQECKALNVQFHLLHGSAAEVLPGFVSSHSLGAVVTDFSPLREPLQWLEDVEKRLPTDIPIIQVKIVT